MRKRLLFLRLFWLFCLCHCLLCSSQRILQRCSLYLRLRLCFFLFWFCLPPCRFRFIERLSLIRLFRSFFRLATVLCLFLLLSSSGILHFLNDRLISRLFRPCFIFWCFQQNGTIIVSNMIVLRIRRCLWINCWRTDKRYLWTHQLQRLESSCPAFLHIRTPCMPLLLDPIDIRCHLRTVGRIRCSLLGAARSIGICLRRGFCTRRYFSSSGSIVQHFLRFQLPGRSVFFICGCFVGLIFF